MGLFPYWTSEEEDDIKRAIANQKQFLLDLGYTNVDESNEGPHLGPDGLIYNYREHCIKFGVAPLCKDPNGVSRHSYVERQRLGYKSTYEREHEFLILKGYIQAIDISDDHLHNITLMREHDKFFGYVPRWVKDGITFGHREALKREQYQY